jgi:hypothetical protein
MLAGHQKHDEEPDSNSEPIASAAVLEPGECPAPIAILSPAKRAALVAFLYGDGSLHKSRGVWTAQPAVACAERIYGVTIADLARDGMVTLTVIGKSASARLTPRGNWFARTLAAVLGTQCELSRTQGRPVSQSAE